MIPLEDAIDPKRQDLRALVYRFAPATYFARSVYDFQTERDNVPVTPEGKPHAGEIIVNFMNTDLEVTHLDAHIRDSTGEFPIRRTLWLGYGLTRSALPEDIESGRYYQLLISYTPGNEFADLFSYRKLGPPEPEAKKTLIDLLHSFQPVPIPNS